MKQRVQTIDIVYIVLMFITALSSLGITGFIALCTVLSVLWEDTKIIALISLTLDVVAMIYGVKAVLYADLASKRYRDVITKIQLKYKALDKSKISLGYAIMANLMLVVSGKSFEPILIILILIYLVIIVIIDIKANNLILILKELIRK